MNVDNELRKLWLSKEELHTLEAMLAVFAQEMHWGLDYTDDKSIFIKNFSNKFCFELIELDYVNDAAGDLRANLEDVNLKQKIIIYISNEYHVPNKPKIIYTALNECSKHYKDYEVSTITGISKEELDAVLKEFKEKVIDKLEPHST